MKRLKDILPQNETYQLLGDEQVAIQSIAFDSRKVDTGACYVAIVGNVSDGHNYIEQSIDKGAVVIVCQNLPEKQRQGITYVETEDSRAFMARMASLFFEEPSKAIKLVGVTGTNGKTSIVTMLYQLFENLGYKVGMLSTIQNKISGQIIPSTHTTPDSVSINALLSDMVAAGCEFCFMEVSSHAIDQHRSTGLHFDGAIFTNITHDHLDYHGDFKTYLYTKKRLFDGLNKHAFALVNQDDKNHQVMVQNCDARIHKYGLKSMAGFKGTVIESTIQGLQLKVDGEEVWTSIVGDYNASNLVAVYGAAALMGQQKTEILTHLSALKPVEGRFDRVLGQSKKTAIVDYAHTPDAIEKLLESVWELKAAAEKIITVVGAGGNRDQDKRSEMGRVAAAMSHKVILTSDNPRNEDPEEIINQMLAGVVEPDKEKVLCIVNRREAIKTAVMLAGANDLIVVAGKGHEKYQEVNGERTHFDDKEILTELLN